MGPVCTLSCPRTVIWEQTEIKPTHRLRCGTQGQGDLPSAQTLPIEGGRMVHSAHLLATPHSPGLSSKLLWHMLVS